jgi:hypothetical protein
MSRLPAHPTTTGRVLITSTDQQIAQRTVIRGAERARTRRAVKRFALVLRAPLLTLLALRRVPPIPTAGDPHGSESGTLSPSCGVMKVCAEQFSAWCSAV